MSGSAAARRSRRGLTLLELLLVLAIVAVVLGAGLGLFAEIDLAGRQAAGLVRSTLRRARSAALDTRGRARVFVDPRRGSMHSEFWSVVGTWHFEGDLSGSLPLDGRLGDAVFVEGYLGRALGFPSRAEVEIPVQLDPAFDPRLGFAIECAVLRESEGGGRLVRLGSVVTLEVGASGALRGRFVPSLEDEDGGERRGFEVSLQTLPGVVPVGRWARVRLSYDRARLTLAVDGVQRVALEETAPVAALDGPLRLSDERFGFPGRIDALVLAVIEAEEPLTLPRDVRWLADEPFHVDFEGDGSLAGDARDGLTLWLETVAGTRSGQRESIVIGPYGTVE